jgi:RNA polymerase sigma-70 factor (ECF subfamily)
MPAAISKNAIEARYLAFLETVTHVRAELHRYCARMTGSALDGEDIAQDALFEAYRKLDHFDDTRPLAPWLFGIAHHRCIDFLRRREMAQGAEDALFTPEATMPTEPSTAVGAAVEHLVLALPPKERACVLLKEVFDYSLEEIAELVDSTVGGVKAALNRGRSKLPTSAVPVRPSPSPDPELREILRLYVERTNRRDWDGLRDLISADARLRVADAFAGKLANSPYFSKYETWSVPWKLAEGEVDGELVAIVMRHNANEWTPYSLVRLHVTGQQIDRIVDYRYCRWMIRAAGSISVRAAS